MIAIKDMESKEMIKLEIGKTYITRNKRHVKIVYESRINEEPYLGVVETDGYEMEFTMWYKHNGLCLWDDFDIVEKLQLIPFWRPNDSNKRYEDAQKLW